MRPLVGRGDGVTNPGGVQRGRNLRCRRAFWSGGSLAGGRPGGSRVKGQPRATSTSSVCLRYPLPPVPYPCPSCCRICCRRAFKSNSSVPPPRPVGDAGPASPRGALGGGRGSSGDLRLSSPSPRPGQRVPCAGGFFPLLLLPSGSVEGRDAGGPDEDGAMGPPKPGCMCAARRQQKGGVGEQMKADRRL